MDSIVCDRTLVAWRIGIVSAAWRVIASVSSISSISSIRSSISCSADGRGTNAYRHSTANGCATVNAAAVNATAIDATVINASAMHSAVIAAGTSNSSASSICESVS